MALSIGGVVFSTGTAYAQTGDNSTVSIRQYVETADFSKVVISNRPAGSTMQASGRGRQRSTSRKVVGGIIGGVGGFFGGGYLGAAIEGDRCECDDPGFVGFLIGAPTGAAIGAILGVKFF